MYPIEKYNYVTYDKKNEDGTITKVTVAMSTYCGRLVKGVAKCAPTDFYNTETGKELAAARCDVKVCSKRYLRALTKEEAILKQMIELEKEYLNVKQYVNDAESELHDSKDRLNKIECKLN